MIGIECILARLTSAVGVPAFTQGGREAEITNIFSAASHGDIDLLVNNSALARPMSAKQGFFAFDLHRALQVLTRNPLPSGPAARIAVLFADFYNPHPSTFGIMFDRGFDPGDDPSSAAVFRQLPREGCAVFLRAITDLSRTVPARRTALAVEREAFFTTIHELGHVFNLQHAAPPPANFMSQSLRARTYPIQADYFLPIHQQWLSQCSVNPAVYPGGARFRDSTSYANHDIPSTGVRRLSFGLELLISMGQREFWPFEPVELDVELRVAPGVDRQFHVPDAVDPGYDQFTIRIEDPNGDCRRLYSPRNYCNTGKALKIAPTRPFRRDISIFGQSGGYTFVQPGIHRLWVEFKVRHDVTLRSNELEVNVKSPGKGREFDAALAVLSQSDRAKILYHRLDRSDSRHLVMLTEYCGETRPIASSASIKYAVARAMEEQAASEDRQLPEPAVLLLQQAADAKILGETQRTHATRILEGARSRMQRRKKRIIPMLSGASEGEIFPF
ncbi:hypothetical protein C8R32_109106 [Nitrosospira sp. Nsp5]|uniref:Uncharacterized protein n=1 Tax=Nitrosospira multiformis TaxID=1231 RepID=A0ABY0TIH6_9PROT|nr:MULTISPECIES: hypothetical protein [Nitrosospira]PTR06820.1 hypothetical protein C8R32_109106 [Nitrosospira sp. Nsp5]SDQ89015.1 hypothetical protein SAMN05216402_2703 [Nitrosospira multiformis]